MDIGTAGVLATILSVMRRPNSISYLIFFLPAISFGILWFLEKSIIAYFITALSVVVGISLTISMSVTEAAIKSKKDLKAFKKSLEAKGDYKILYKWFPKGFIALFLVWVFLSIYAIFEAILRLGNIYFAFLFLAQLSMITYLIAVNILFPRIVEIELRARWKR